MKQKLRIVLVGLVVSLMSQATFAQYAASAQQVVNMEQSKPIRDGQLAMSVGKTIMLTGASIAMTGIVWGAMNTILDNGDDVSAFALGTALGCYYGGLVALVGLPFHWAGKHKTH